MFRILVFIMCCLRIVSKFGVLNLIWKEILVLYVFYSKFKEYFENDLSKLGVIFEK